MKSISPNQVSTTVKIHQLRRFKAALDRFNNEFRKMQSETCKEMAENRIKIEGIKKRLASASLPDELAKHLCIELEHAERQQIRLIEADCINIWLYEKLQELHGTRPDCFYLELPPCPDDDCPF